VLVRQGRVVAATFHPELTRSRELHAYLASLAEEAPAPGDRAAAAPAVGTCP